ncbi:MAG: serine/threonine-protein kinase [Planctomycetota bacterium]
MAPEPLKAPGRPARFPEIPGYEIESVLGRGATGVVYRARQGRVGREVALKVLHPELAAQPRVVQRLQREARTTARLAHPHLVTAVDMGEIDGLWWYAMEYVDGPSLALRLREEGRISEREALRLFIPLCEALEHLWEHGVVHRDIKPANILIDRAGGARLADFGLAFDDADDQELTKDGGMLGTPAYISPEQAVEPHDADVRSDLWSFGATLFHAVCGRPPFSAESAAEVISGVLYGRIPRPQELSPSLSRGLSLVLRKCLTRDRDRRYQTPGELLADLERIRERRSPRVRRAHLDPVQRRHDPRATWAVAGVLAVAAVAAVAWAVGRAAPDEGEADRAAAAPAAPFAPLEELAGRAGREPGLLAQELSELEAMEPYVPAAHHERWAEVARDFQGKLRAETQGLQDGVQGRVEAALAAEDFATAWTAIGAEFDSGLLARTGYRRDALAGEPALKPLGAWLDRTIGRAEEAEGLALERLSGALAGRRDSRFAHVARLLERQEWNLARAELLVDGAELLGEAGFAAHRLRPEKCAGVLDPVLLEIGIRRQRLDDDWQALDHALRRDVIARSELLEAELARQGMRQPPASTVLAEAFERMLQERRLRREKMPAGLRHVAIEELAERVAELVGIEDRLLEENARRAFAETRQLAAPHWRGREYAAVAALWTEMAGRLDAPGGIPAAPWRQELAELGALYRGEAQRLQGVLERAARRVSELDGQAVDLWVRGIRYEGRTMRAGVDPLAEGFALDGLEERLDLRRLSTAELETLAGLKGEETLDPAERLLAVLLRYHDGDFAGAQRARQSGDLPDAGEAGRLALDVCVRITEAIEELTAEQKSGRERARELLERVGDPARQEREPHSVLLWIDELLEKHGDLAEVQRRRGELLVLRERLRPPASRARPEDYARVYGPARVELEGANKIRLEYEFADAAAGAWDRGDWVLENLGWTPDPGANVTRLEDLRRQRGPTLNLVWPIDTGGGELELALSIAAPASDPTRLLTISAAGFHVAFVGTHLPGGAGERLLVESGSFEELLEHVAAGRGTAPARRLKKGETHEILLRLAPRSGRIAVLLDGEEIASPELPRPDTRPASIVLRAMERVTLRRATLLVRR